jgi:hypothetical protein
MRLGVLDRCFGVRFFSGKRLTDGLTAPVTLQKRAKGAVWLLPCQVVLILSLVK